MKKLVLLIALACGMIPGADAQSVQSWSWAKPLVHGNMPEDHNTAFRVEHVDKDGNYYVASVIESSGNIGRPVARVYVGSDSLIVGDVRQGIFLMKFDSSGTLVWKKKGVCAMLSVTNRANISGIRTDNAGNVYVSLHFYDSLQLDNDLFTETTAKAEVDLLCLNATDGSLKWRRPLITNFNARNEERGPATLVQIDVNAAQEAVAVVMNPENDSLHILKYNAAGNQVMYKGMKATVNASYAKMTELNAQGPNIVLTAVMSTNLAIGATMLNLSDGRSFIVSFDASGDYKWSRSIKSGLDSSGSETKCYSIDQDAAGNIYFTGEFRGAFIMTGTPLTLASSGKSNAGNSEVYFGKTDASGNVAWLKQGNGERSHDGQAIRYSAGKIYLMGQLEGGVFYIGGDSIIRPGVISGSDRFYIVELDTTGKSLWARRVTENGFIRAQVQLHLDAQNNIYFTGGYESIGINYPLFGATAMPYRDPEMAVFFAAKTGIRKTGGNPATALSETLKTIRISVYPNPAASSFTIVTDAPAQGAKAILMDISGRIVLTSALVSGSMEVDISALNNGVYFLRVEGAGTSTFHKLIKQ